MPKENVRKHEVAFCSEVSKWSDRLFEADTTLPFGSSDIESFGTGSRKRQDFRVYERKAKGHGRIALCGEVKLPGSRQGRTPFDLALYRKSYLDASMVNQDLLEGIYGCDINPFPAHLATLAPRQET